MKSTPITVIRENDSIGYRSDSTDLEEIDAAVRAQLTPDELARWKRACDDGRGPDATPDTSGVRWVVDSRDLEE